MADCAICVAVRSRPLLRNEHHCDILSFEDSSTVHLQKKSFTFDYVFKPGISNGEIYKAVVQAKIRPIFEGYNVTILAYGPTGSGKTYTMGTDYNPKISSSPDIGIIPRGITEIFREIESRKDTISFIVKVSFLELYREEIFDLLQNSKTACSLRDDGDGVRVVNLTEVPVGSVEEAFATLEKGSSLRHTSATAKNLKSSRSHAIFSVYIEQTHKLTLDSKRSKFQLVDLAGSERMSSSKTDGIQVKEGININLGLLSLGKVINHLIEDKQHIPYRDSKLTRLLQDSLGGNSHTVMIACVNPSSTSTEETLSTLRYASNTRRIKNRPVVNVDPPDIQIQKLKKQVEALQAALYGYKTGDLSFKRIEIGDGDAGNLCSAVIPAKVGGLETQLQNAFSKISCLVEQLTKLEDKCSSVLDGVQSLYEKIKFLVTEMTALANPSLNDYLVKLEEIRTCCLLLMVSEDETKDDSETQEPEDHKIPLVDNFQSGDAPLNLEESGDSVNLNSESELGMEVIEEISDKHKIHSENLETINRTLSLKYDQVKHMATFFQQYETTINEDYINTLINQINQLVMEKNKYLEDMEVAKKRSQLETVQKIENYEKEISKLQAELRKKKVVLQAKEENQVRIQQLLKEINVLKKNKVQLVKQMRQDCNKFAQKQREKEKEVAKLVREGRRKEHELVKMKNKFEKEVNVLRQKIDRVNCAKSREMLKKNGRYGIVKSKPAIPRENIQEWIMEELKIRSDAAIASRMCESFEKDAVSLKERIKSMEELSNPIQEGDCTEEPGINSEKAVLEAFNKRIAELKETCKIDSTNLGPILESINSMSEAKIAIETLFNECVQKIVMCDSLCKNAQEHDSYANSLHEACMEQNKSLQHTIDQLNEKINSIMLEQEKENAFLKYQHDTKMLDFLTEFQVAIKSNVTSETDQSLREQIEAQEREIQRLQYIHKDYDQKCKEVAMLQERLFQAKKGKKATWLGKIQPSASQLSASTSPEDKTTSMLEEYLTDSADESFGYDKTDPDWRLTPAHKRQKELKMRKEGKKRQHPEEPSEALGSCPKKHIQVYCRCRTDCKSLRCPCKKNNVKCTNQCSCSNSICLNMEKEATVCEEIMVIDDKKLSFVE